MTGADQVLDLHAAGVCPAVIARRTGLSRGYVYRTIKRAGETPVRRPDYLSDDDRREIAQMLRARKTQREIAEWLGVSRQRVNQIALELGLGRRRRRVRS